MAVDVLSRKEMEDQQRREHILLAAERLFAGNGFANTSVSQIAKESEFGVGTLYKYFKDKTTILQELFHFRVLEENPRVREILWPDEDPINPARCLDRFLEYKIEDMCAKRDFYMVFFTYVQPQLISPDFQGIEGFSDLIELRMKNLQRMADLFVIGIERGQFADVEPHYYLSATYGAMVSYFYMLTSRYGLHGNWPCEEVKQNMKTIFYNTMLLKPIEG
jgi:AcrR family transcriptional regulator